MTGRKKNTNEGPARNAGVRPTKVESVSEKEGTVTEFYLRNGYQTGLGKNATVYQSPN